MDFNLPFLNKDSAKKIMLFASVSSIIFEFSINLDYQFLGKNRGVLCART